MKVLLTKMSNTMSETMSNSNTMSKNESVSNSNTMSKTGSVSNSNTMSKSMSKGNPMSKTMSNSNTMPKTNTMSKCNTMSNNSRMSNSMSNWVSNNSRMSNWVSNSVSIGSNTLIGHISNITIIIIGMIVDMLNTAIRKVNRVGSFNNTSTIIGLSLVESSTRVVISNSIGVRVGRGLSKVRLGISPNSMMSNNWSMVDNRSMGNSNWVS